MKKLHNIALFVGTNRCNAKCVHCAGLILRRDMPREDKISDENRFRETLKYAHNRGSRALSLTSAGETTLAPNAITRTLEIASEFAYKKIKLYTNGILIGESKEFAEYYLPLWQSKGLTNIYLTIHSTSAQKNANIFNIKSYPDLQVIVNRIHNAGLKIRANIVLSKNNISDLNKFSQLVLDLKSYGFDNIAAWPVRDENDDYDIFNAPSMEEIEKMRKWALNDSSIVVQTEEHHKMYENKEKLGLFPNGKISNKWCQ